MSARGFGRLSIKPDVPNKNVKGVIVLFMLFTVCNKKLITPYEEVYRMLS